MLCMQGRYTKGNLLGISLVRTITIQQPATTNIAHLTSLEHAEKSVAAAPALLKREEIDGLDHPVFKTVGTPASSLSVSVPPSVPVHVKKGSVISVYSFSKHGSEKLLQSKWEITEPVRSLISSGRISSFQRLIGTVPIHLLVSAYSDISRGRFSKGVKSFVSLSLDGSYDWVVFQPNALQCYAGNSLNVRVRTLPKDLQYGFKNRGFTWLNGRGIAGIVGNGNVFNVTLGIDEEIRIARDSMLAITVGELNELRNGSLKSEKWDSVDGLFHKSGESNDKANAPAKEMTITRNEYVDKLINSAWELLKLTGVSLKAGAEKVRNYVFGNGDYVVVKGPRTVLISTGSGSDQFVMPSFESDAIRTLEDAVTREQELRTPKAHTGDNLGVLRIVDGKAIYKNVANFDDEVKRIESLKKK